MSLYLEPDLFIRIKQLSGGPVPLPMSNGFREDVPYRVRGGFTMSESSEMYFLLANDRDEPWWIANRHCRIIT
jgi:hypothetical protein